MRENADDVGPPDRRATISSAVPGKTVLRVTTISGRSRSAMDAPICWQTRSICSEDWLPFFADGVPTQSMMMSLWATASAKSVVARKRPAETTSSKTSLKPGSKNGASFWLTQATL